MSNAEAQPIEEETSVIVTLVAARARLEDVALVESLLPHAMHLKPLWERMMTGQALDEREEEITIIGLPISHKVTADTIDNHRRHLFSLFNLLGMELVTSPMALETFEIDSDLLRGLKPYMPADPEE